MIYAAITAGLLAVGTLAPEATSAALTSASHAQSRELLFKLKKKDGADDGNEGDEGNEGNEGLGSFKSGVDDGDEGDEGDEGNEGDEGDEGVTPAPTPKAAVKKAVSSGKSFVTKKSGSTSSAAVCTASSSATAFASAKSATVSAVADAFAIVCNPNRPNKLEPFEVEGTFKASADVTANAIAKAAAECTSSGNAFGCAQAKAQAAAWASATAEAYASAYAEAFNGCGTCDPNAVVEATSSAEAIASDFVELVADVYARAEVQVCVRGDDNASAEALTTCFAGAWAKVFTTAIAKALVTGSCTTANTEVFVAAVTKAEFSSIETCAETVSGTPGAVTDTDGSTAEADVTEVPP